MYIDILGCWWWWHYCCYCSRGCCYFSHPKINILCVCVSMLTTLKCFLCLSVLMLVQIINRPFILFEHESLLFFSSFRASRVWVFVANTIDKKAVFFVRFFLSIFSHSIVFYLNTICHLSFAFTFVAFFSFFECEKTLTLFIRLSLMCNIYTHIHRQFNSIQFDGNLELPFDTSLLMYAFVWLFFTLSLSLPFSLTSIVNHVRSIHLGKNRKMICACTVFLLLLQFDVWFLFYCAVNAFFSLLG